LNFDPWTSVECGSQSPHCYTHSRHFSHQIVLAILHYLLAPFFTLQTQE